MKAYKFRVYPTKAQERELNTHLWRAKNLWNELLDHSKQNYEKFDLFPTKNTLQAMSKNHGLFSQTQQEVSHRVFESIMRTFKLRKKGIQCGFPRFKSIDSMRSLYYPQAGFKLLSDREVRVAPFGKLKIKQHREIEGIIKTLTLKKTPTGKWFATFCVEQEPQPITKNMGQQVGIDLGLKELAVISDGTIIHNPRHLKGYVSDLASAQRKLSKKVKGSKNRKKAKLKVAKLHEKVSNTRDDFLHKTTTNLVSTYSLIALEKLASKEMSQQNFGKQINDASWNKFANMMSYKAESAGCEIVFVNPRGTTKTCSCCGNIQDMPLSERTYNCPNCGMIKDRDLNAAINILERSQAKTTMGHIGSNASGDYPLGLSMNEEALTL
jgi:putative transposase